MKQQALIAVVGACVLVSSQSLARGGGGGLGHSGSSIRSGAASRAPAMRAPTIRYSAPMRAAPHPGLVHRSPTDAGAVRRVPEHFVNLRGRNIGIPPLAAVTGPIILDIPPLGKIFVPQETYVALYPLLISNNEADRERAFMLLKRQVEHDPDSHIQRPSTIAAGPRQRSPDWCPDCRDTAEIVHSCRPFGDCDTAVRLMRDPKRPVDEWGPNKGH